MPRWPTSLDLPGTDRAVARMGLGAMHLSLDARPDHEDAKRVVQRAVEGGIDLIDTADVYTWRDGELGHNERLVADALREMGVDPSTGLEGSGPVVTTKGGRTRPGGAWGVDGRPERLAAACHASLRALGVERIPLYQLHTPDPDVPFVDSVGALARLREEGKIGLVGLSNVTPSQIDEARTVTPIATVQNPLSAWDTGVRTPPVVSYCARHGILFLAYAPLGGAERASRWADFSPLAELASQHGVTPQELALGWLLDLDPCVLPIPGARYSGRVDSNLRALRMELDDRAMKRLRAVLRRTPGRQGLVGRMVNRLRRLIGAP